MNEEKRSLDWVMVLLVSVVVFSPAMAIATANWTDNLEMLWSAALFGMAAGVLISVSRFRSLTAHLLSLIYGVVGVGYLVTSPMEHLSLRQKILDLYGRVSYWIGVALKGGTGRDSIMFVLLLALLFWWIGYLAIWNTVRQQRIWRALIPSGVALFFNYFYYSGPEKIVWYLIFYLLFVFLVIVRSYTVIQERRWFSERIGFSSDVRFDLLRWGLVLALATVTTASFLVWVVPITASSEQAYEMWRHVEGPWRKLEEDFNRMFSTLRSQARAYGNPFGRMILLRGPRTLTDTPVLQIAAPANQRFYWRGVSYDRYTGSSWINSDNESVQLNAPWYQARMETYSLREEITQTVTVWMPVNTLTLVFAAPQPVRLSVTAKADAHLIRADGSAEFSQLTADHTLRQGSTYMVVSSVSIADPGSLRSAGTDYPTWVTERYLQLPESLPTSVRQQAKAIAGDKATPYDKASAIEAWLRENVRYDDQTPAPPEDEDGVAYVLSVRRGYCDYYASAMAVMLRSLNIPARIAVGYAQGKYDPATQTYRVTEKDSHTWVEVFFPNYGWVEFEPTASQPAVVRPTPQPANLPTPTPNPNEADSGQPNPTRTRRIPDLGDEPFGTGGGAISPLSRLLSSWIGLAGIAGIIIALAFVLMWVIERRRSGGLPPARRVAALATKDTGKGNRFKKLRLLQTISHLGLRAWLGLLGVVELALALAMVLVLSLGQSMPASRLNATVRDLGTWLGAIALVEMLIIVFRVAIWIFERRGLGGLSAAAQIYARLLRFSGWLNVRWKESQTPHERGMAFALVAPAAHDMILEIVDSYTREQYSATPPDTSNAERLWQATSPLLWLAGVHQRLAVLRDRWRNFKIRWEALSRRLGNQFG